MAKQIKSTEIIQGNFFQNFTKSALEAANSVDVLEARLKELKEEAVKTGKTASKNLKTIKIDNPTIESFKKLEATERQLTNAIKKLTEIQIIENKVRVESTDINKKIIQQEHKLNQLEKDGAKQLALSTEAVRKQNAELRVNAKRRSEAAGSLNQYRAQLIAVRIKYDSLNKAERENTKIGGRLLKLNTALDKKVKDLEKTTGRTARNVGNYTDSIKNAAAESGLFSRQITILNQIKATLNALTQRNTAETTTNTVAKESNRAATASMTTAQKALTAATNFGSKALKGFKIALASTGVGALVLALGGLVSFFTSTQRGADALGQKVAGLGAIFDVLKDRLSGVGEGLSMIFSGDFSEGLDKIKDSFTGIGDEMAREGALAQDLEAQLQRVIRLENDLLAVRAANNKEINQLKIISGDILKTTNERIAAAQKAVEIEENLANASVEIQRRKLAQILGIGVNELNRVDAIVTRVREGSISAIENGGDVLKAIEDSALKLEEVGLSESMEEDRAAAINALAAIYEIEEQSFKRTKKLKTQISSIIEQDARRRLTIESLRIQLIDDAEEKALANEVLRWKREKIEAEKVGLDLELIESVHLKRMQDIRDGFEADRLKKEADRIAKENERRKAREEKALKDAEALANFEAERRVKEAKGIDDIENAEIEAAEQRTQFLLANDKLSADEKILIEKQLQAEITDIQEKAEAKRKEIKDKAAEEDRKRIEEQRKEIFELTQDILSSTEEEVSKRLQAVVDSYDKELEYRSEQIELQKQLAANGQDNELAFQKEQLAKTELERKEALERQQKIQEAAKLAEIFLTAFEARLSDDPDTALSKAFSDTFLAKGVAQGFATLAGFSEGGYTGDGGKLEAAGIVHKGEFVVDKETTAQLGLRNKSMLDFDKIMSANYMDKLNGQIMQSKGGYDGRMYEEMKGLRSDLKTFEKAGIGVNDLGEVVYTLQKGNTRQRINFKTRPIQ